MRTGATRSARLQVGIVVAIVLSFVVRTGFGLRAANRVDEDLDVITRTALPGIHALSTARSDLHRLELDLNRYARDDGDWTGFGVEIEADRSALDEELNQYFGLPDLANEAPLLQGLRASTESFHDAFAKALTALERHDPKASEAILVEQHAAGRVAAALSELITFSTSNVEQRGRAIEHVREQTLLVTMLVDGVSIALAAAAALLAVIAFRRSVRSLELEKETAARRASLSDARSQELEVFAARIAHDVLSPLMGVVLSLELAKRKLKDDPKALEMIGRGLSGIQRVRRIVDGLLEFARAGTAPENAAPADVREVAEDVVEGVRPAAQEACVEVTLEPVDSCLVACSSGVLTSLLSNLIQNAIKHMGPGPERQVTVRARGDRGRLRVEIEDTGPGIAPDAAARIFEPFVRLNKTSPGLGLGLATVKRLVTAHGGTVGCEGRAGRGSRFWFELPCAAGRVEATNGRDRASA